MLCGHKLGETTILMLDHRGILGIWCGGRCLQDIHAVSILQEIQDDITEAVDARSWSPGDEPGDDKPVEEDG